MATTSHPLPDEPGFDDSPAARAALVAARSLRPATTAVADVGSATAPGPEGLGDLPPTLGVPGAARLLGISRTSAHTLIRHGTFPCPVFRCGARYKIPTAHLLKLLGLAPSGE
ncbi:helix-turn-helix domain-containing protein [Streptacidiphilus sp. N1-10]|uniref:Helix-turn-helix domain-containing protein n=1 Tax=Streptacidiphilus jeojiensis TaxID=3229225 RepID=A0ABV6XJ65_9ACTN